MDDSLCTKSCYIFVPERTIEMKFQTVLHPIAHIIYYKQYTRYQDALGSLIGVIKNGVSLRVPFDVRRHILYILCTLY